MMKRWSERYVLNHLVREGTLTWSFKMLSDAVIILANMRGNYVNVGSTVHTLFRMRGKQSASKQNADRGQDIEGRFRSENERATTVAYSHKEAADEDRRRSGR
jgi:hypothetical protein